MTSEHQNPFFKTLLLDFHTTLLLIYYLDVIHVLYCALSITYIIFDFFLQFNVSSDGFRVQSNDRIGWTNEDEISVISFTYIQEHRTYYRKYPNSDYPTINTKYAFDTINLPSIFSIAVKIDPSKLLRFFYRVILPSSTRISNHNFLLGFYQKLNREMLCVKLW